MDVASFQRPLRSTARARFEKCESRLYFCNHSGTCWQADGMAFADDGMAVHHGALMPEDLMADGGDILGDASILVPMFLLQLGAHPPNVCGLVAR